MDETGDSDQTDRLLAKDMQNNYALESLSARFGSNFGKKIPKIKVCHKSDEFEVISAVMVKLKNQKINSSVTSDHKNSTSFIGKD